MSSILPSLMTKDEFVDAFGGVFEHSPWVADDAFAGNITAAADTVEGLHLMLCQAMRAAGHGKKLVLIRAHPDLAGKLAVEGKLTKASSAEQKSAGLDICTPKEFEQLTELNSTYAARFGFPFIMAVKGSSRGDIIRAMEERVTNNPETEFETAIGQIERIALLRLQDIFGAEE